MIKNLSLISFLFLALFCPGLAAQDLTGRQIMGKAFDRYDGDDGYFQIEMVLVDRKGGERRRRLELYTRDYGLFVRTYLKFTEPADISGTGFLTLENEGEDDTQYLYLPALGRVRRIVSSQKANSFVNTDFTYEDMERRRPEEDEHILLRRDAEIIGKKCYVVESVPAGGVSQYSKRINYIDADTFLVLKVEYYDKKGAECKELSVEKIQIYQDIPTAVVTVMKDLGKNTKTIMSVVSAEYNTGIKDEVFTTRYMEDK